MSMGTFIDTSDYLSSGKEHRSCTSLPLWTAMAVSDQVVLCDVLCGRLEIIVRVFMDEQQLCWYWSSQVGVSWVMA
jgi:hypothetical protein